MVDENRPQGAGAADGSPAARYPSPEELYPPHGGSYSPRDYEYYGPFGSVEHDDTQPIPGLSPSGFAQAPTAYPAPGYPPPQTPRRPMRSLGVVLVAGLTALVIGTAAGFGGSRLADLAAPAPSAAPLPRSTPGATRSPVAPPPARSNTVEVAKTVLPSTVMIRSRGGSGTSSGGSTGSGFILDTEGHIMTNNHVVAGSADGGRLEVVFTDGRTAQAKIVGRSPSYDLAVIKVAASASLVPMQIGDSDATQVGETVIAVGAPLALPGTVTEGIISSKDRPVVVNGSSNADSPSAYINAIQTDTPINPGNSGGPLVDGGARVVGVNSAILTLGQTSGQSGNIGLGFAIPINQAIEIGELLIKDGKATYPVIGASVASADDGVRLSTVEAGGPADDAGLAEGDIVTSIDSTPVADIEQLIVTIRTHRPGDVVKLRYRRDSAAREARVTLGGKEG